MLHLSNLTKTYSGEIRALDGINLDIPKGMFGLLGPNGYKRRFKSIAEGR